MNDHTLGRNVLPDAASMTGSTTRPVSASLHGKQLSA